MATNNRLNSQTDLFYLSTGEMENGGYISKPQFPFLAYHGDTWRKRVFFNEFMYEYEAGNKEAYMKVLKKVWCEHNTSCRKDRRQLNLEILLEKCTDRCRCCGTEMWYGRCNNSTEEVKSRDVKPSIDRLNPNGGYTDANTWIICTTCNTHKNNAGAPERLERIAEEWRMANADKAIAEREEMRSSLDNF
jgi:hypothetical protein